MQVRLETCRADAQQWDVPERLVIEGPKEVQMHDLGAKCDDRGLGPLCMSGYAQPEHGTNVRHLRVYVWRTCVTHLFQLALVREHHGRVLLREYMQNQAVGIRDGG